MSINVTFYILLYDIVKYIYMTRDMVDGSFKNEGVHSNNIIMLL